MTSEMEYPDSSHFLSEEDDDEVDFRQLAEAEQERKTLARKENQAVACLRVILILVLLITATLASVGVYLYTKRDEEDTFSSEFAANAEKILESFQEAVETKLNAVDTLSVTVTSYALDTKATFPNVTIPDFEYRGANTRIGADATMVYWLPLVTDETRAGYEAYANANKDFLMTSFMNENGLRAKQDAEYGLSGDIRRVLQDQPEEYNDRIYGLKGDDQTQPEGSGPFLPIWQSSPVLPVIEILNFDILDHPGASGASRALLARETAVIDVAVNLQEIEGDEGNTTNDIVNLALSLGQDRHKFSIYDGDPFSSMVYPVFSDFGPNRSLAGALMINLYWSFYFSDILPPNAHGIIAVLENSRNQSFTYQIDGPNVIYVGPGDVHDIKFEDMAVSEDVSSVVKERAGPATKAYTAVDLDDEYCTYTLRVYPSSRTEDDYITNRPIFFTGVVALIFVFTSLVFILYDYLVARRQRIVMNRAIASGAIVSSLFPENIRNQLYQENREKQEQDTNKKDFINSQEEGGEISTTAKPIANLYEETTILFADLAGFTKWSSKRSPVQVFELLETIYGAFDAIALKRGIFKVETIGDCYVAVTGIPVPQKEHAVIMAKFARDCMMKLRDLTTELAESLGADTADLEMRVGLHSGPTTAGVLRGAKSRFQLFGDSVNTASRMESTGVPGQIHISQTTADALIAERKGHWVALREEKIVAKGKGEMQTYWVQFKPGTASTTISHSTSEIWGQGSIPDEYGRFSI